MSIITITRFLLSAVASTNQPLAVRWRKQSDPDVLASYVVAVNVDVDPAGYPVNPNPYTLTVPNTPIVVQARDIKCDGDWMPQLFFVCEDVQGSGVITGTCPPGYDLSPDGSTCIKNLLDPPTPPGISVTSVIKVNNNTWNNKFARLYQVDYPVSGDGTVDVNLTVPHFWLNGTLENNVAGDHNTVDGRFNVAGIWFTPTPSPAEWVGFSRTIVTATPKMFYLGISTETKFQVRINGVIILDATTISSVANMNYWNIYPIILAAGNNIIEMVAQGTAMAVELYNNTRAQIIAALAEGDLNIIFSTKDLIGQHADLGVQYGYSCAPDYAYDTLDGLNMCTKLLTASPA